MATGWTFLTKRDFNHRCRRFLWEIRSSGGIKRITLQLSWRRLWLLFKVRYKRWCSAFFFYLLKEPHLNEYIPFFRRSQTAGNIFTEMWSENEAQKWRRSRLNDLLPRCHISFVSWISFVNVLPFSSGLLRGIFPLLFITIFLLEY